MSSYPQAIDTDEQLPALTDGVSEIGTTAINSVRDAVLAIERAIGQNPQGNTASLVSRLARTLNEDGTIKAQALLAAGLVSLPITDAQISNTAGIKEAKLDLDVPTDSLQNQITSNDEDIAQLQKLNARIYNDFSQHIAGTAFLHDSFDVLLSRAWNQAHPGTTPPSFVGLTGYRVGDVLLELNDNLRAHEAASAIGAHKASNISVDGSGFVTISPNTDDVQEALTALDQSRNLEMIAHRDSMHANGFDNWANDSFRYSRNRKKVPHVAGDFQASVTVTNRNKVKFTNVNLASARVSQGDVVVISDGYAEGIYIIDDVGPRGAVSAKPILTFDEVEATRAISGVDLITDGYVSASIFGAASVPGLKTNLAPTIYQSTVLDTIQLARPNSAKLVSLGIQPQLLANSQTLVLETGLDTGSRTITVSNLRYDRAGPQSQPPTVETVSERINAVMKAAAFPAAAYVIGDELMLGHNLDGYIGYSLTVHQSGTANTVLGFDGYGSGLVENTQLPTKTANFYVNGFDFNDLAPILRASGTASGTAINFPSADPVAAGVRVGHLLHVTRHPTVAKNGTYLVTGLNSSSVTVHTSIGSGTFDVQVLNDSVPLAEFASSGTQQLIEIFVDDQARTGYNLRLTCEAITGLSVVNASDNALPGQYHLFCEATTGGKNLSIQGNGVIGPFEFVPTGTVGRRQVYFPSNIETISVDVSATLGTSSFGGAALNVFQHIDEEEVLEICSVRSNGSNLTSDIVDKRLFGSLGLDELREDVVQAYVETPLVELRTSGIVRGFNELELNYSDFIYPSNSSQLILGGTSYVNGVRLDVPTRSIVFPIPASAVRYTVCLNQLGDYVLLSETNYTLAQILAGDAGALLPIRSVLHSGASGQSALSDSIDLRFFINNLDAKLEFVVDVTDSGSDMRGNFSTFEAALHHANSYPNSEKPRIKVVSRQPVDIVFPSGSRDLTLEIDGQIGNLVVDSNLRVFSTSIGARSVSHISGAVIVSGASVFEAENISVDGYLSVLTGSGARASFNNVSVSGATTLASAGVSNTFTGCRLAGLSDTGTSALYIDGCRIASGNLSTVKGSDGRVRVRELVSTTSSGSVFRGGRTELLNSLFDGNSSAVVVENGQISGCVFQNSTRSSGTILSIETAGSSNQVLVSGCAWQSNSFTGTGLAISNSSGASVGRSSVDSCTFSSNSFGANNPFVKANEFTNNVVRNSSGIGNAVVRSSTFSGNQGFPVFDGTDINLPPRIVSNNLFGANTIGYNAFIQIQGSSQDLATLVSGNKFLIGSGQAGLLLATENSSIPTWSPRIVIDGNYFTPGTATISGSFGINLGTVGSQTIGGLKDRSIRIINNTFRGVAALRSSGLTGAIISNNSIDNGSFTLDTAGQVVLSGNRLANNTVATLTGPSTVLEMEIESNSFDDSSSLAVNFSGSLENSNISLNNGFVSLGCSLTGSSLVGNVGGLAVSTAVQISGSKVAENILTVDGTFGNITWSQSALSQNTLSNDSTTTITLASTECKASVVGNSFDSSVEFACLTDIDKLLVADNFCTSAIGQMTFTAGLNNSFVSRNFDFAISLQAGGSGSSISSNLLSDKNIVLDGSCENIDVSSNAVLAINVAGPSLINSSFQNNTVLDSINLTTANITASKSIENCSVVSNQVGGSISVVGSYSMGAGSALLVDSLNLSGNTVANAIEALNLTTIDATATIQYTDNTFANNSCTIVTFSTTGAIAAPSSVISGNVWDTNTLAGDMTVSTSAASAIRFANTVVKNSVMNDLLVNHVCFDGLTLDSNSLSGHITIAANNTGLGQNFLSDLVLIGNDIGDRDISLTVTDGYVSGISLSGNRFRALKSLAARTGGGSATYSNILINGNKISGSANSGTDYPGLQFRSTGGNGSSSTMSYDNLSVSNNFAASDFAKIIFDQAGVDQTYQVLGSVISTNSGLHLETVAPSGRSIHLLSAGVNNNINSSIYMGGDGYTIFENALINGNYFIGSVQNSVDRSGLHDATTGSLVSVFNASSIFGNIFNTDFVSAAVSMRAVFGQNSFIQTNLTGNTFRDPGITGVLSMFGKMFETKFADNVFEPSPLPYSISAFAAGVFNGNTGSALSATTVEFDNITDSVVTNNVYLRFECDSFLSNSSFTGNSHSPLTVLISDFSGIYSSNLNSNLTLSNGTALFSGAFYGNSASNLSAAFVNGSFVSNVGSNLTGTLLTGIFANNYNATLTLTGFSGGMIGSVTGNTGSGSISILGSGEISGNISNNYVANITLNPSGFQNSAKQLKVVGNTCSGTLNTTATFTTNDGTSSNNQKTFFWGNTSIGTGSPQNLTITGTAVINVTTSNKIGGTINN